MIVLGAVLAAPVYGDQTPRIVRPGAPGEPTREISADDAASSARVGHGAADTRFMQGMIGHHAQALEMVALVASHSRNDDLKRLADNYAKWGGTLREAIDEADESGDDETADLFTEVGRGVGKSLYFLESHFQRA